MTIWAWIGLLGILILAPYPLLKKENRSKEEIIKVIITVTIVLTIIVAVQVFNVNYIFAFIVGVLFMLVLDKKTYTKKRIMILSSIIVIVVVASYVIFRDNPDYVLNHLKENPQTTSMYLAENGVATITYQSDSVRPLASTVKMLVAIEYALQIDAGKLHKDSTVSLEALNRYYLKATDGNAHEAWIKMMDKEEKIINDEVTLHDVAKGMIVYSSNANTDYLIDLLGAAAINERAKLLGLTQHEEVYPIVSPLLIPVTFKKEGMDESRLIKELEAMPIDAYRELAQELSEQMKAGKIRAEEITVEPSLNVQKVWSDRLPGASANDYGKLLAIVSNDQLPKVAAETARDLLEWPMDLHESNEERFAHFGAKGGETLFVLTDALYVEDHKGNTIELVVLTDELTVWQSILMKHNMNSFEAQLLSSEAYRLKVQKTLLD